MKVLAAGLAAVASSAAGQPLTTTRVASGLSNPVFVTAPPGDSRRLFIAELNDSSGLHASILILRLDSGAVNAVPFLTITDSAPGLQLLGLAFDTGYGATGRFFIHYVTGAGTEFLARYTASANPDLADPASVTILLSQANPGGDHHGGWLGFGPDGYLYATFGDGGPWYDPSGRAQDLTTIFGKVLRLDVSGPSYTIPPTNPYFGSATARPEIWAYGLRNPWRAAFDRATGDLWIADVGQDLWEELDFQPAAGSPPVNYGWRCYEANAIQNSTTGPGGTPCSSITNLTFPILAYDHTVGCSIIGGSVYRGQAIPALRGTYFYADWCSNHITSLRYTGGVVTGLTDRTAELATPGFTIDGIVSFGEDADGELYICDTGGGEVYRIIPRCWTNCDGSTLAPTLNIQDFACFLNAFAVGDAYANCDGSTLAPALNIQDFACFLNRFAAGCS